MSSPQRRHPHGAHGSQTRSCGAERQAPKPTSVDGVRIQTSLYVRSAPKGSPPSTRSPSALRASVAVRLAQLVVHRELGSFVTGDAAPPGDQRFNLVRGREPIVDDEEPGAAGIELLPAFRPSFILPNLAGVRIDLVACDLHALKVGLFSGTTTKIALDVAVERRVGVTLRIRG